MSKIDPHKLLISSDFYSVQGKELEINKQSAVEWLIEKLDANLDINHSWRTRQYIEQAKEMGKQQIIDAANLKKEDRWFDAKLYNNYGEKYYAETYGINGSDECYFEQITTTSSATICKHCGKEKFLHKQLT